MATDPVTSCPHSVATTTAYYYHSPLSLTGKDINLTGKNVAILAAENQSSQTHSVEQKSSGLTLALSGAVGSAANTAVTTAKAASEESNGRLAALQGVKATLNGAQAVQAGQLVQAQGGDAASMFGISAPLGSQKSSSQQHQEQTSASGSTLTAGNNLTVTATGEGNSANSGDIVVQGSQLKAGGDTTGVRVDSKTIWKGKGQERIDVENPAPGKRAGQVHYQDNKGNKYYYDPITQSFPDAPKSVNAKLENSDFKNAVEKGMSKYLGEK
nr:hemagglutinin repeat-containing protein [Yersinia mollaretii]